MDIGYNADEIYEIGERIERNGATFYRRGAEIAKSEKTRDLLLSLAAWEEKHEELFAALRKDLVGDDKARSLADPEDLEARYLYAAADSHMFNVSKASEFFKGGESELDILNIALGFEKDSIVLFIGMKQLVQDLPGKEKVDRLIREEMQHVTTIKEHITRIK